MKKLTSTFLNLLKSTIYLVLPLLVISCGQEVSEEGDYYDDFEYSEEAYYDEEQSQYQNQNVVYLSEDEFLNETGTSKTKQKSANGGYKYYSVMSQQFGIPVGTMIIPNSWNESTNTAEGYLFEGPNGLVVYRAQSASHFYSEDYAMNQNYMQMGRSVQPPKSLERFIQEDLSQHMANEGFRYVGSKPLPEMAQFDTRFDSYLFKAIPEQKRYTCMVTDWEKNDGTKAMLMIRFFENYYQIGGMDWGYTINAMASKPDAYENAKNTYIYSLLNFWINPQWVQANNTYWSTKSQQSTAAHNQRMADIKAQGQAIIERGRMHSEMLDRNHEQFMSQLRSDNGHSQFLDYIRDETNVTNSYNGQTYKVESGSNYYWMNNDGKYIRTDDANWNPNTDPTFNSQDWSQAEINR